KFYIYFFGLICHVGDYSKKHFAAMVRDPDHYPAALFEPLTADALPDVKEICRDHVSVKFRVGDVISISDATSTAAFRRFVPSLERLMGGSRRANIGDYAILVYYPES